MAEVIIKPLVTGAFSAKCKSFQWNDYEKRRAVYAKLIKLLKCASLARFLSKPITTNVGTASSDGRRSGVAAANSSSILCHMK